MQNFTRIKSAPKSFFNEQYNSKCGMNLGGVNSGPMWVVYGD